MNFVLLCKTAANFCYVNSAKEVIVKTARGSHDN